MVVDTSFFRSETSQKLRAEGAAKALLVVIESRGLILSEELRALITDGQSLDRLDEWTRRAATATTAEEIFAQDPEDN
ncbi:hypothetical protein RVR_2348 [Actinacidiphila reveromycinica]|uniref:Uncharacterized protein n=1 Tax=Actinacidiphila reveromycinica TaxID=659352 RepID=A0A7U3UQL3_9ACTN|nr:hypothetical protein [Streptomyces sp. SN-593]BBA96856.1 hypothetical protein RVR_2348 [Streptomyces sp. SN-593]